MSRGPDAATLLERALVAAAATAGCPVTIVASDGTRWASATFTGAQHRLTLTARSEHALDAWLAGLADSEFCLRGHLVADLVVTQVRREADAVTVALEALTVEAR